MIRYIAGGIGRSRGIGVRGMRGVGDGGRRWRIVTLVSVPVEPGHQRESDPQINSRIVSHVPDGCRRTGRWLRHRTAVLDRNHPDATGGIALSAAGSANRLGKSRIG